MSYNFKPSNFNDGKKLKFSRVWLNKILKNEDLTSISMKRSHKEIVTYNHHRIWHVADFIRAHEYWDVDQAFSKFCREVKKAGNGKMTRILKKRFFDCFAEHGDWLVARQTRDLYIDKWNRIRINHDIDQFGHPRKT